MKYKRGKTELHLKVALRKHGVTGARPCHDTKEERDAKNRKIKRLLFDNILRRNEGVELNYFDD